MKVIKFADHWNPTRVANILGQHTNDELVEIAIACGLGKSLAGEYTPKLRLIQAIIIQLGIPQIPQ